MARGWWDGEGGVEGGLKHCEELFRVSSAIKSSYKVHLLHYMANEASSLQWEVLVTQLVSSIGAVLLIVTFYRVGKLPFRKQTSLHWPVEIRDSVHVSVARYELVH